MQTDDQTLIVEAIDWHASDDDQGLECINKLITEHGFKVFLTDSMSPSTDHILSYAMWSDVQVTNDDDIEA